QTAIVLGTDEAETTKLMLNLMQQYNLEASDMAHISDVLAGALANTSFQGNELMETMKYAGVAAGELGWSLAGTIPIIDAVIKVTGEASMAGTQFRMMIMKLRDPTAEMIKEFEKFGITMAEVAEAIKTPTGLVKLLNKAHEEGATFVLTNAPIAMRMGEIKQLAEKTNSQIIPADATSVPELTTLFTQSQEILGGKIDFVLHSIGMSVNI
ncbi:MAG: phage tail tape measure protein, partial [Candidatus Lokiarchaeota archaeon]|nr:phage tail tape measure protein [Candidatus Lokiarchaeota archaeon]